MVFNRERPGVRESRAAAEPEVLDGEQEFPGRKHLRVLAPGRQENVNSENNEVSRQNPQRAPDKEAPELDAPRARPTARGRAISNQGRKELTADQVAAKDKEEIDADPAEAMDAAGERETHDAGVVNNNDYDRERAEEIETRLALAIGKARIDFRRQRSEIGAGAVSV